MTLYALLIAAIILPCVYVAVTAWTDYHTRVADASDLVARNARVAEEHALKVFVTLNERIVDLLDDLDATAIRRDGATIHQRLRMITGAYQQVAAASVYGPDGRLLATSRTYPTPDVSIADRDDFDGLRAGRRMEQISRVTIGRVAGEQVFNTAVVRRTPAGKFDGVVSIALRPSYFADFCRELIGDNPSVSLGLSREDGEVCSRDFLRGHPSACRSRPARRCAKLIARGAGAASSRWCRGWTTS